MEHSRTRKSGFNKVGEYVEVRVTPSSTYNEVFEAAAQAVDMYDDSSEEELTDLPEQLSLFRADGTRIPNSPVDLSTPWTIDGYMSTFPSYQRSRITIKLGVGRYTSSVSTIIICWIVTVQLWWYYWQTGLLLCLSAKEATIYVSSATTCIR